MTKTYWLDGIELDYIEGYDLEKLTSKLERLGILHKQLVIKDVPCSCRRYLISNDESRYERDLDCEYHKMHTQSGHPR